MKSFLLVLALAACAGAQSGSPRQLEPPVAKRVPHPTTVNGETLPDDYFWLREKASPQVVQYLHAEVAYADAFMQPTQGLQRQLYQEMLSRVSSCSSVRGR